MSTPRSRRAILGDFATLAATLAAALALPSPLAALTGRGLKSHEWLARALGGNADADRARFTAWTSALRTAGLVHSSAPLGRATARVGELAIGSPYVAATLEAYLRAGGSARHVEPLTLSLMGFDCVTLVESCIAVARTVRTTHPSWGQFSHAVERMRYRGGIRGSYSSRLHYFSEWIHDGARRGLLLELGATLGGDEDTRPLRFMSEHRASYAALADARALRAIRQIEQQLDTQPRRVVPTARIAEISSQINTGDVLAFATSIPGLDVTHAALAYRDASNVLRVLHAPLSGGAVEISHATLPDYVAAIRHSTGIIVARPL